MNEQLKALVWKLDREIWAKVEAKEATTSWARQESAKLIQDYSDQQNKELKEEADELAIELHETMVKHDELFDEAERLTKEVETMKEVRHR